VLDPGQIFAHRYRVIRHIAEGGMGAIFEAEHTATERKVALKLLFPHIMSVASARKKFELEAKISARVNSPNIVEVLDAGFDEGTKSPFLVMELLDGQTLCQYVREQGPLGVDQALPLLQQIAAGLDAAHGYKEANGTLKPIVHRDLKPENLFLAHEHGAFVVKILDFGIAKVLGETGNVSQEVRGTPLYMAYEQVTAGALSPQTDIWALGLIAYYMFTASHYWRSANDPNANVQSLFAEILTLPLEAPSLRLVQNNVQVKLAPAFDAWLLECIQRDPARRFVSAGAAVQALARAFGRVLDKRARVMSTRPLAMAATEAFAPAPVPVQPAAPQHLGTAASLPGIASEHVSVVAPAPESSARGPRWLMPAAVAGALLLGGVGWLVMGGGAASSPNAEAGRAASAGSAGTAAAGAPTSTAGTPTVAVLPAPASDDPSTASREPQPAPAAPTAPPPRAPVVEPDVAPSVPAAASSSAAPAAPLPPTQVKAASAPVTPVEVKATPAVSAAASAPHATPVPARPRKPVAAPPAARKPAEPAKKSTKTSDAYRMR
jgi:hypothetical protein